MMSMERARAVRIEAAALSTACSPRPTRATFPGRYAVLRSFAKKNGTLPVLAVVCFRQCLFSSRGGRFSFYFFCILWMLFVHPHQDLILQFTHELNQLVRIGFRCSAHIAIFDNIPFISTAVQVAGIIFPFRAHYQRQRLQGPVMSY
jgi:hypothetical protein